MSVENAQPTRRVVCVQGLGFAGAAMAVAISSVYDELGEPYFDVIGVDLSDRVGQARIDAINAGRFPFETADSKMLQATAKCRRAGNLRATSDPRSYALAEVIVMDVNLDIVRHDEEHTVDFLSFREAVRTVGTNARAGALIIVETTVPPGTCAKVVVPELAKCLEARDLPADALLLAHSYERVMPGEGYLDSIKNYWRVYAGHTPAAAAACREFLSRVVNIRDYPLFELPSTTASETAKVMENSYRATNIAFVEEWARFAETVGIDLFQVIDAIRQRPTHNNIRQPGFGVGGYCLPKDPLLPGIAARELFRLPHLRFPLSEIAVATNRVMPLVSVARLQGLLDGSLQNKTVLLLGVAYRPGVADTRHSPSETFACDVIRRGGRILAHDPLVKTWPETGLPVLDALPDAAGVDAVVFAVPDRTYREIDVVRWLAGSTPAILDANNVLGRAQVDAALAAGCKFASIGRG